VRCFVILRCSIASLDSMHPRLGDPRLSSPGFVALGDAGDDLDATQSAVAPQTRHFAVLYSYGKKGTRAYTVLRLHASHVLCNWYSVQCHVRCNTCRSLIKKAIPVQRSVHLCLLIALMRYQCQRALRAFRSLGALLLMMKATDCPGERRQNEG
jgi:hypothetical protein